LFYRLPDIFDVAIALRLNSPFREQKALLNKVMFLMSMWLYSGHILTTRLVMSN